MPRASLTTGPLAGRTMEIAQTVYNSGVLYVLGDLPPEEVTPWEDIPTTSPCPPVHEYRRVKMATGLPPRYWWEWHYVPPKPRPEKTDAEKLALITRYCRDLQAMSKDEAPGTMTAEERIHWEAVCTGYHLASETILNIIDHGSTRPRKEPRTP